MEIAVASQPFEGGHLAALGAEGGNEATVHGLAVEPDGAGPAVPGIATLSDSKPAELPGKGAQALADARFRFKDFSVDPVAHGEGSG